jgi:hypothetical protein
MTHTFTAAPARSRTPPHATRGPHSKNPVSSTFSEKVQITFAMRLLHAGVDTTVIAPEHADMTMKENAVATTTPTGTRPGRYKPPNDDLMTFLKNL